MAIKDIFENYYRKLNKDIDMQSYKKYMENKISNISISPTDRLYLAREKNRPTSLDFLDNILEDKIIFKGDRIGGEDSSIISGIGRIKDLNISFVAIEKGKTFQEKVENNFGMVSPEGFRKAIRIFKEAEKFNRPVLTIIDTPGANPSPKSEENGQSQQIANSLLTMSSLKVPIISMIISEGYSGGALSLSLCDYLIMLENAIFSILSPEGFGSIIFRDSSKVEEATKLLKFTAKDMKDFDICQEIIPEKIDPSYEYYKEIFSYLQKDVYEKFKDLQKFSSVELIEKRHERYMNWD